MMRFIAIGKNLRVKCVERIEKLIPIVFYDIAVNILNRYTCSVAVNAGQRSCCPEEENSAVLLYQGHCFKVAVVDVTANANEDEHGSNM